MTTMHGAHHIVDLENLVVGGVSYASSPRDVGDGIMTSALKWYQEDMVRPGDLAHYGIDVTRADLLFGLPAGAGCVGHGKDGADRALLQRIDIAATARGCTDLVIASGDHCFAPVALEARTLGLRVTVVAWQRSLATCLSDAADVVAPMNYIAPGWVIA